MDKLKTFFIILVILFILRAVVYYMRDLEIKNKKEAALKIAYEDKNITNMGINEFSQIEVYAVDENLMPTDEKSSTYGVKFCENKKGCYLAIVNLEEEKVMKVYRVSGVEIK